MPEAVQHVIDGDRFDEFLIPEEYRQFVCESWDRDEHTIYGRFDLAYDGRSPPKLLEYNADTPTSLLEAAVIQWHWFQDVFPGRTQFNTIHERLLEAWQALRTEVSERMYFASVADAVEDFMNVSYLRDVAIQAGFDTAHINIEDIGWDAAAARLHRLGRKADSLLLQALSLGMDAAGRVRPTLREHLPLAGAAVEGPAEQQGDSADPLGIVPRQPLSGSKPASNR